VGEAYCLTGYGIFFVEFIDMQNNQPKNFRNANDSWNELIIFLKIIPFIVFGISCIYNLLFRIEDISPFFQLFKTEHIPVVVPPVYDPPKSEMYYLSVLFLPFIVSFQITSIILILLSFFEPKKDTVLAKDKDAYFSCVNIRQHGIKYFILSTLFVVYFLYYPYIHAFVR
jgi:hypothetical protein